MNLTPEQLAEAKAMIEAAAANNGGGTKPDGWGLAPAASFGAPQPANVSGGGPRAVMIPIKIPAANGGSIRVYLEFPGEAAANPQALMGLLGQLAQSMPLDVWMPKNNFGGGGYRNGGGGGGWGGGNGGNRGW
jgi:hypothetical protein